MNNIVFQVNIKGHRAKPEFEYSTKSWSKWCKKNGFQHFVLTEPVNDLTYMNANWHKFYVLEMLDNEGIDYWWEKWLKSGASWLKIIKI